MWKIEKHQGPNVPLQGSTPEMEGITAWVKNNTHAILWWEWKNVSHFSVGAESFKTPLSEKRKWSWSHEPTENGNLKLIEKYPISQYHIKYAHKRNTPYIFEEEFPDIEQEYAVLCAMHRIDPDHVVKPITRENNGTHEAIYFYVTEKYDGISLQKFLHDFWDTSYREIFISELERTLKTFHSTWIVHGDILSNVLIQVDEKERKVGFKIIDPVWVQEGHKNFELFKQKDIDDIQSLREENKAQRTPINQIQWEQQIQKQSRKYFSLDDPSLSHIGNTVFRQLLPTLKQMYIPINTSLKEKYRALNISPGEFLLRQLELWWKAIKQIRWPLEANEFQNSHDLIINFIESLWEEEKKLITPLLLKRIIEAIEKQKVYFLNAQEVLRTIWWSVEKLFDYDDLKKDIVHYAFLYEHGDATISMRGSVICVEFKDDESFRKILSDTLKESYGWFACIFFQWTEKEFQAIFIPPDSTALVHEVRHAAVNATVFHQRDTFWGKDWKVKEEIIAYLSNDLQVSSIQEILTSRTYGYSNVEGFEAIFRDLSYLEKNMDMNGWSISWVLYH